MSLAKVLLATLAALALTACGGEPGPRSGVARPEPLVSYTQPAGGQDNTLRGVAEPQTQAQDNTLRGVAEPQPRPAPQGLVGQAQPVAARP